MKRLALAWAGPALCALLVIYVVNERTKHLEGKVDYQRELINSLRVDVKDMRDEWGHSVEGIRNDIRGQSESAAPIVHQARERRP